MNVNRTVQFQPLNIRGRQCPRRRIALKLYHDNNFRWTVVCRCVGKVHHRGDRGWGRLSQVLGRDKDIPKIRSIGQRCRGVTSRNEKGVGES